MTHKLRYGGFIPSHSCNRVEVPCLLPRLGVTNTFLAVNIRPHPCPTGLIFAALFALFVCSFTSAAQLSGVVDFGVKSDAASAEQTDGAQAKQITVTGIGLTPESAEKQAITDAVRQAVGAYVDANTIVENEAVIKDRILSVSNGFVKEYKVVSPAKQRDDGLYELQILATVQTGQVVQALKESNLISGEVAGANMWAEASTKVMNAQDAVAMLQAKIPELIKSSVTITPLGEDGKPMLSKDGTPNTAPASVKEDAVTGNATLTWYFKLGLDKKFYIETLLPLVKRCLDASLEAQPKEMRGTADQMLGSLCLKLVKSIPKDRSICDWFAYAGARNDIVFSSPNLAQLTVTMLDAEGDVVSRSQGESWQPFATSQTHQGSTLSGVGPGLVGTSAYNLVNLDSGAGSSNLESGGKFAMPNVSHRIGFVDPVIVQVRSELPVSLLKLIKRCEVSLDAANVSVALKPFSNTEPF